METLNIVAHRWDTTYENICVSNITFEGHEKPVTEIMILELTRKQNGSDKLTKAMAPVLEMAKKQNWSYKNTEAMLLDRAKAQDGGDKIRAVDIQNKVVGIKNIPNIDQSIYTYHAYVKNRDQSEFAKIHLKNVEVIYWKKTF